MALGSQLRYNMVNTGRPAGNPLEYTEKIRAQHEQARLRKQGTESLDSLINQLKEVQLAALMGGQKSSVILADSTDLGDRVKQLGDDLTDAFKGNSETTAKQITEALNQLAKAYKESSEAISESLQRLSDQLSNLESPDQQPVVVPAPVVQVKQEKTDLKPIVSAIKDAIQSGMAVQTTPRVDLSSFMAQDIKDSPDGLQYILAVNSDGVWRITQNDDKNNKLRFVFGTGDYSDAWDSPYVLDFKTLSEALREVQA